MLDFAQYDSQIDAWIDTHRDEMVAEMRALIHIPSVLGDAVPGAPFGVETRRALDFVVQLTERYGLTTKMLDGYAMHAEMGQGKGLVGVLAHVDVVPEGQDWVHGAFEAALEEGKVYGRGAIDDKGPAIAGLYAMFAVKECGVPLTNRIRAIIGADEETGFRCVEHYFKNEEMPDVGFTPDGSFPAIFAEKGIASPVISAAIPETNSAITLVSLQGGARSNMVPDRASALLVGNSALLSAAESKITGAKNSTELTPEGLWVRAVGVSAHASYPHEGTNAIGLLCDALLSSGVLPELNEWLETLKQFATDNSGAVLGIDGRDDVCGPLTSNLGVATTADGTLSATFSVRYPVTWLGNDVRVKIADAVSKLGWKLAGWSDSKPLYVPENDPLVETLLAVYRAETGDMSPPKTMGGGTYARSLKKGIAFGPNFPGFPDVAHKADEFWFVDELILATRIYAKALARLATQTT